MSSVKVIIMDFFSNYVIKDTSHIQRYSILLIYHINRGSVYQKNDKSE